MLGLSGLEGMDIIRMRQQLVQLTNSLFQEGFLDEQFTQLQQLQDESNPDFVGEVVSVFFEDSEKMLDNLRKALEKEPVDFKKIDAYVHQFKGSSSSIGAQRVKNACITFRVFCDEENQAGCLQSLQQIKQEYYLVKNKLEDLIQIEQQILAAGGTIPFME